MEKNVFLHKKMPMIENLSDTEILQRLKRYDEKVTNEFFYDTCRIAYCIDDKRYGLRYKTGMDFYSLAHDYYLRLCNNDWRQLEERKPNITLANWTINRFHYLVRERLNTYLKKHHDESLEERTSKGKDVFDTPVDNTQEEVKQMVEEICHAYYAKDRKAQSILRMILIMGMKGKEVAKQLGITPAAVSQRYHTMMDKVVRPYFIKYYTEPCVISQRQDVSYLPNAFQRFTLESPESDGTIWKKVRSKFKGGNTDKPSGKKRHRMDMPLRITPSVIHKLYENEIFVFGSDLRGVHCGGTAYQALRSFGAQLGKGVGPQGQCYAIPTIVGGLKNIRPYISEFLEYAINHPQQTFFVTPIGCGIAGFTPKEIAPMFDWAKEIDNVYLPQDFWDVIV